MCVNDVTIENTTVIDNYNDDNKKLNITNAVNPDYPPGTCINSYNPPTK